MHESLLMNTVVDGVKLNHELSSEAVDNTLPARQIAYQLPDMRIGPLLASVRLVLRTPSGIAGMDTAQPHGELRALHLHQIGSGLMAEVGAAMV